MLCAVDSIEGIDDADIIRQFQMARDKNYDEIFAHFVRLEKTVKERARENMISTIQKERYEIELRKLKAQLNEIISLDYFRSSKRMRTEKIMENCNELINHLKAAPQKNTLVGIDSQNKTYTRDKFQNKTWVTRKGIHIDRIASIWLIKRFIDKKAKFFFVSENTAVKDGVGFDIYDGEFSHRGEDCTFETLLKSFSIKDLALSEISEIVHDIDLKDEKFNRPEAVGINQIIIALSQKFRNDYKLAEKGIEIFDLLYNHYFPKNRDKRR